MAVLQGFLCLLLAGQVAADTGATAQETKNHVLSKTYIRIKDEANIPAVEPGMLTELTVREGSIVKQGDKLAQIDDREAKAALEVTQYALNAAAKRAKQDIEERYALAASLVAEADYKKDLEANQMQKGAVPESELQRKKLDWDRTVLQIEKAKNDQVLAAYDWKTKQAERDAAEMALGWRTILAPFEGEVVKTFVHQSEWVNPGDPILRLASLDTLYVEGDLYAGEYDRGEVVGKPVTIEVQKARGRNETVTGKIIHVDQFLIGSRGRYTVRAEVQNRRVNGRWLLHPGGVAQMTIHLEGP